MKLLFCIGLIIFLTNCTESNNDAPISNQARNESNSIPHKWNTFESEIDLDRVTLNYDSVNNRTINIEFTWSPKNENTEKSIKDTTYNLLYLYKRTTILKIQDVSEILLDKDYFIPQDNIKVDCIFYGLYSNFESFKNLKGKIRFSELTDTNTKFKILLTGELNEMIVFKNDTILNAEIKALKE
jgi:hypothetical protein